MLTSSSLLAEYQDWPYLAQAFQVVRLSQRPHRCSREVRYRITSVPAAQLWASKLLARVRRHWQIENGLHYRRAGTLQEHGTKMAHGKQPQPMAALNNFITGLLAKLVFINLAYALRLFDARITLALARA